MAKSKKKVPVKAAKKAPAPKAAKAPKMPKKPNVPHAKAPKVKETELIRVRPSAKMQINKQVSVRRVERNTVNRLKRAFENENRKTYADKIRKQLKAEQKRIDKLNVSLKALRTEHKAELVLKKERASIQREIRRLEKKMDRAYDAQDIEEYKKLSNKSSRLDSDVKKINRDLGYEYVREGEEEDEEGIEGIGGGLVSEAEEEMEPEEEPSVDEYGFIDEPTPLMVWDANERFDRELDDIGHYNIYIINGRDFYASDVISLRFWATQVWRDAYARASDTMFTVSVNEAKLAIMFTEEAFF
jgi:hypothetical protein